MTGDSSALRDLNRRVVACARCPRLVEWREHVAGEKRAAFRSQEYWGRPVPSFGDPAARVLIVGLAPAAHGANRTGRMFTGDRSGKWLFRALHRAGFASHSSWQAPDDGLRLQDAWLTALVRCAPPENRPTPVERRACQSYLEEELRIFLPRLRAIVALGGLAWDQVSRVLRDVGLPVPRPWPPFRHGGEVWISSPGLRDENGGETEARADLKESRSLVLLGSYHPSQQNTFTGRLTEAMFDDVWSRARDLVS